MPHILHDAIPGEDAAEMLRARRLAWGFTALLTLTLGLIVLGALVRANGAGLACPDWPLCFGEWVPRMDVKIGFEWTHRAVAGSISILFVALSGLTLRQPFTRGATARPIAIAAVLLLLQILLGALTVWKLLAAWSVTSHLLTGNAFALTLLWIACTLRDAASPTRPRPPPVPALARHWFALVAALLVAQFVLGGLVSSNYAGLACPEWPACNAGVWFPTWGGNVGLHLLHRINGYALAFSIGAAAVAARRDAGLRRIAAIAAGVALCQVLVGIANVLLQLPVEITALHSALASGLAIAVALGLREIALREIGQHGTVAPDPR